ncbi:MAG: hypothetical protein ACK4MV_18115 [Beijerinckiaceae bacterium]
MNRPVLASALLAAIVVSACAPNEPPRAAAPQPVAAGPNDRIISGPAPVPSASSMGGSQPDYVMVGRDPVPNLPDDGSILSPDSRPYGSW